MQFCYLHPNVEAEGRCYQCKNWICLHCYNLLEEEIGEGRKNWHSRKTEEDEPVVLCPNCYAKDTHNKANIPDESNSLISVHKTKPMMCYACGGKITAEDKFCPTCGESLAEEDYDADHPLGGVQSSKES